MSKLNPPIRIPTDQINWAEVIRVTEQVLEEYADGSYHEDNFNNNAVCIFEEVVDAMYLSNAAEYMNMRSDEIYDENARKRKE